jgi:mono/diheme cytochrome c family protein
MVLATLALSVAFAAGDASRGKPIYTANCMACHGEKGDGRGPAAVALRPAPPDLTRAAWWDGRADAQVIGVIRAGRPGTPMLGNTNLKDEEIADLVAYLRALAVAP